MNHEYLFRESGQSGMDQLKIGGLGAEPPEKIKYLIYNYEYLSRQIEPNQEEEEIQEEDVDSEAGLEDKMIPENYRSQHQMEAEGKAELDDLSDFENIWEPRQENNNGSNIVEMEDSYDEIDILNDDFEFS